MPNCVYYPGRTFNHGSFVCFQLYTERKKGSVPSSVIIMNPFIPDWNYECDLSFTNQKKPSTSALPLFSFLFSCLMLNFAASLMLWLIKFYSPNSELAELLWQNGQVVMQSQTPQRASSNHLESRHVPEKYRTHLHQNPVQKAGGVGNTNGNSSILIQGNETVSWIQYPIEDSFEKEFCSPFFTELPPPSPPETNKPILAVPEQSNGKHSSSPESSRENQMPPLQIQLPDSALPQNHGLTKVANFSQFFGPIKGDLGRSNPHFGGEGDVREVSGMTVGSSHCGSNQVILNGPDFSRASSNGTGTVGLSSQFFAEDNIQKVVPQAEGRKTETLEPTVTSSSGGSGSSLGGNQKNSVSTSSLKRKGQDVEDSEGQSEVLFSALYPLGI